MVNELHDPGRDALSATVEALVRRHGGPSAVGNVVGADRSTIHRWMRGDIGMGQLGQLAFALGEPVVVRFGPDTQKEAAPEWERLEVVLEAVRLKLEVSDAELLQAEADLLVRRRLAGTGTRRRQGGGGAPGGSGAGAAP